MMNKAGASETWEQTCGHFWDWKRGPGDALTDDLHYQILTAWGPDVLYLIEIALTFSSVFIHWPKGEPCCYLRRWGVGHIYDSDIFLLQVNCSNPAGLLHMMTTTIPLGNHWLIQERCMVWVGALGESIVGLCVQDGDIFLLSGKG